MIEVMLSKETRHPEIVRLGLDWWLCGRDGDASTISLALMMGWSGVGWNGMEWDR
jgi:hypothetical protein